MEREGLEDWRLEVGWGGNSVGLMTKNERALSQCAIFMLDRLPKRQNWVRK